MNSIEDNQEKKQPKTVILILTHSCNLNCIYCYEHHKDYRVIDVERAKGIIEMEMNANDDLDREFEFLGGEPLLEFEKIIELHEFLCSHTWTKKWSSVITTNGTLVHGNKKIKEWLLKNKETVRVSLSVDGTPEMQNKNRSNSYEFIDYSFFIKIGAVIKMTISAQTLSNLAEGIIYLHNIGFKVITANLAFGIDWSESENLSVYASELRKLADYYLEHPELRPTDILNMQIDHINPNKIDFVTRHCGAGGNGLVAYEVDGTAYPCHTFAPISVGEEIAKKSLDLTFEYKISLDKLDDKCRDCIVVNVCPNCYGINFSTMGNMYSKDDGFCKMAKVQFMANAYFKYRQYVAGVFELLPEEEYRLLYNINQVQKLKI